jgi:Tfp pilus assembly PilM family ATPase
MSRREGTYVAINLENDRFVGVMAHAQGSKVVLKGWVRAERPSDVDPQDPGALGRWLAEELKKAGMLRIARRGRCVFGVPRAEVVLKRITFPPGTGGAELPGMVRLQMVRQLTVSPDTASIDFAEIPAAGSGAGADLSHPGGVTVLAGALQADRLEWRRAVAAGAGIKLSRVSLKSAGAAALLAGVSERRGGAVLGIALGCGATEFVIVENGQLVFARATDLVRPEPGAEDGAFAEKVAVEAKRTWMSYRATAEAPEIDAVIVLGDDAASRLVAERCREGLGLPAEVAGFPEFIEIGEEMSGADRAAVAPLAGLVAEPVIGRATIDFLHPRKAPDLAAVRRQRVLLGSLAAVLVLGGGYTAMQLDLAAKERRLDQLKQSWATQSEEYSKYVLAKARLEHLERWEENRVFWPAHLRLLNEQLPDPRQAQLDELAGRSADVVEYNKPGGKAEYSENGWGTRLQTVFTLAGRMKERAVADTLRSRLADDSRYKLESKGPDLPERFDWRLVTPKRSPDEPEAAKGEEKADAKKASGKDAGGRKEGGDR